MVAPLARFFAGVVVGAVGAWLYKDEQLRSKIGRKVDDWRADGERIWDEASHRFGDVVGRYRHHTEPAAPPSPGEPPPAAPGEPPPAGPEQPVH